MANLASAMTPMEGEQPKILQGPEAPTPDPRYPEVSGFSTILYHHLGVETPFDPQHRYVTSYLVPVPILAIWRVVVALYMLFTAIATAVQEGIGSITYFTNLSYWGDVTYFVMAAVHTCSFWFAIVKWSKAKRQGSHLRIEMLEKAYPLNGASRADVARGKVAVAAMGTELHHDIEAELAYARGDEFEVGSTYPRSWLSKSFPRPLQFFHSLLVTTVYTYPLVVTVIFWTVLKGTHPLGDPFTAYVNVSKHTLNLVLTQIDLTLLSRTPMMPWWHLVPMISFLGLYIGIVDITYKRYGVLVYGFFNVEQFGVPLVVLFCILLAVFAVVSFLISQLLVLIRETVAARVQQSGGWGSAKAVGVDDDACIPTTRGPGPLGGGGVRTRPGHDSLPLRGRFPSNALRGNRSSVVMVVDDDTLPALLTTSSNMRLNSAARVLSPTAYSTRASYVAPSPSHRTSYVPHSHRVSYVAGGQRYSQRLETFNPLADSNTTVVTPNSRVAFDDDTYIPVPRSKADLYNDDDDDDNDHFHPQYLSEADLYRPGHAS